MLGTIEQKLTSILADTLVTRAHLDVLEAPGPAAPAVGRAAVLVALGEMTPAPLFEREQFAFDGTRSRRILPLQLNVIVDYGILPAGNGATELAAARALLPADVSLIGHALAHLDLMNGKAIAVADPGPGLAHITI